MAGTLDKLKVLLLQARQADDPMAAHERRCFVDKTGLGDDQFIVFDLTQGPPQRSCLTGCDVVMVGGAGDYYVSKGDLPGFDALLAFFRDVVADGFPMFASCFGYQCLVLALGGEILYDPANTEVGTYRITLTEAGETDELFSILPARFRAQEGHKDRATRNPPGALNLASSAQSPYQALRIPGQPIWATQFHPELDRLTNRERYEHYLDGYAPHMSSPADVYAGGSGRSNPSMIWACSSGYSTLTRNTRNRSLSHLTRSNTCRTIDG